MRKTLFVAVALVGGLAWLSSPVLAGGCKGGCPCKIKGAEKTVTNTDNGVTITITAKDQAVVKQIQDAAAKMKDGGCEKCSGKTGCKCPQCAKKGKCTGKPDCKCPKCAKHKAGQPEEKK